MSDPLGLEQTDPLGLAANDPLGLEGHERSYAERVLKEGLPAVANTATSFLSAIPAGIMGAGETVGSAIRGRPDPVGRGVETIHRAMESMQEPGRTGGMPQFRSPQIEEMQNTLGEGLDTAVQGAGQGVEALLTENKPYNRNNEQQQLENSPLYRGVGETLANLAPIPGARAVSRIPHMGSAWKAERAGAEASAQALLQRKMAGENEYGSWEAYSKERQDNLKAQMDLDNAMVRYPKNLQAPQLGAGGKVAKYEDQVGKRERGKYTSQMAFDEEMRKTGQDYAEYERQQKEAGRQGPVNLMTVPSESIDVGRRPVEQKTNIKGPEGRLITDAEELANEVANKMNRPKGELPPPETPSAETKGSYWDGLSNELNKIHMLQDFFTKVLNQPDHLGDHATIKNRLADLYTQEKNILESLKISDPNAFRELKRNVEIDSPLHGSPYFKNFSQSLFHLQTDNPGLRFRDQMGHIAETSEFPAYRTVARLLLKDKSWNPRFEFNDGIETGAQFQGAKYLISLRSRNAGNETALIHEGAHSRTQGIIEMAERHPKDYPHLVAPVKRLRSLYDDFKIVHEREFPDRVKPYGLTNIHEFIAEAFSNAHFQALLARTPYRGKLGTYWDSFVHILGKILGFDKESRNYLSEVMKAGAEIIEKDNTDTRGYFPKLAAQGKMGDFWIPDRNNPDHPANWKDIYQSYDFEDFKRDLAAQNLTLPAAQMRAMFDEAKPTPKPNEAPVLKPLADVKGIEKIQREYIDHRTFEEALPSFQAAKDVGPVFANTVAKILAGKFTSNDHPLWSWTSSKIHEIKYGEVQDANAKMHGAEGSRKNPEPSSYNHMWNLLKRSEKEDVRRLIWEFNDKDTTVTDSELQAFGRSKLGHELGKDVIKSYRDRVRINKEVLEEAINKTLRAEGKPEIPPLPNYGTPNVFKGPFLLKFIDPASGETVKIHNSYLRPNIEAVKKSMPQWAHMIADDSDHVVEHGLKGNFDSQQLEWVLRQLHKEMRDPAAKAIAEGLRRQGFMKHGLKRRGVEGGAGSTNLREYETTSEDYIRNAYTYRSNRILDKLHNQILDEKSINDQPHAKGFALEAVDVARGGMNTMLKDFDRAFSEVVRGAVNAGSLGTLKLPARFTTDALQLSNRIGILQVLGYGNLTNIMAQLLQSSYTIPALQALAARTGGSQLAVFNAMAKAADHMAQWNSSKDLKRLRQTGVLDPITQSDWSTYASDTDPRWKSTMKDHLSGTSILYQIEADAVRRPAALMFLNLLRELGYEKVAKDKNEIYYVTKELTNKYMVANQMYEKPHAFSRTGLTGKAIGPLQNFATTWVGSLREYSKLASEGLLEGSPSKGLPLMTFMGLNLATAGVLGLVGMKEWDGLAMTYNNLTGSNVMTGTEWVMSTFHNQKMRFGALSDAIGMHVGASLNAPTLTGSFGIGPQTIWHALVLAFRTAQYAGSEAGLNEAPESYQMRDAFKGLVPRWSPIPMMNWGDIEEQYTPKGMPYQDTKGNASVMRDEKDWLARKLGTYSIKETAEKNRTYVEGQKGAQRSQRLSTETGKLIDTVLMQPEGSKERVNAIFQNLAKDGFSGEEIRTAMQHELLSKILPREQRLMGKGHSTKQAQMIQLYNQLK